MVTKEFEVRYEKRGVTLIVDAYPIVFYENPTTIVDVEIVSATIKATGKPFKLSDRSEADLQKLVMEQGSWE